MLVRDAEEFNQALDWVVTSDTLAIDTETTGLHPYQEDRLTGISVAGRDHLTREPWSFYLPVGHAPSEVKNWDPVPLIALIDQSARWGRRHLYHHGKFDWAFMAEAYPGDLYLPGNLHDTKVCAWLADENQRSGLKEQAALWWGEDARAEQKALRALLRGGKSWADLTAPDIAEYAEKDAVLTAQLFEHQAEHADFSRDALEREHAVQRSLYRMIRTGIRVDASAIERQESQARLALSAVESKFEGVNLDSPKQLAKLLYEDWSLECPQRTPSGAPSTSRAVLETLEGQHPGVAAIMEQRRLRKALSAYYAPLRDRLGRDGRIHPWFSSTSTVTGRFSCSDPNLQTIPRGDTLAGVRDVFVPAEGYELWEYDLSSAELRVIAGFANEPGMISALEEGRDLHGETAASIFGPDFTGLQRRLAKNLNYGFAYGIGPEKFATYIVAGTGKPVTPAVVAAARQILDGYRRTYPRLVRLMSHLESVARSEGRIPLHVDGRFRHFRSPGVQVGYYTALNAIVQGGIGEFMKEVMVNVEPELKLAGARLCLQVHDSLVIEVPPGSGRFIAGVLQRIADDLHPFRMRMLWDAAPWGDHD